jgi:hypothetical protein
MSPCFNLYDYKTSFLPDAATIAFNKGVSRETEEVVKRARPPKPIKVSRLEAFKGLEEFIFSYVSTSPADRFERLLPGAELYLRQP